MDHTRKTVLIFLLDRDTVSSITHCDQIILKHRLLALVGYKFVQLVMQFFICQFFVPSDRLQTGRCIVCDLIAAAILSGG